MRKALTFFAIFLLGIGTSYLFTFLSKQSVPPSPKPVEITQEATSVAILGEKTDFETAVVSRVIDGDTIELTDGRKLRYIGLDTPELVHPQKPIECFGREAKEENKRLVEGRTARLEKDISDFDKYGRLLRYVYVDDVFINDYLVRQGFAHASTYPPDVKYSQQFLEAEREAHENNRGLWAGCASTVNSGSGLINTQGQTPSGDPSVLSGSCVIKGNISSSGEKIYHIPGCGSYAKTSIDESKGERWFCTEDEAVKAGWRKAKNC